MSGQRGERRWPLPVDGALCRRLGERVGREWSVPLVTVDYGGPLIAWMGTVIRLRRHPEGRPGPFARFDENLWWVRQEHGPATMATRLRVLGQERTSPGSGTTWRSVVPAEQRALITALVDEVGEQLAPLRSAQHATIKRAVLNKVGTTMGH